MNRGPAVTARTAERIVGQVRARGRAVSVCIGASCHRGVVRVSERRAAPSRLGSWPLRQAVVHIELLSNRTPRVGWKKMKTFFLFFSLLELRRDITLVGGPRVEVEVNKINKVSDSYLRIQNPRNSIRHFLLQCSYFVAKRSRVLGM